MNRLKQSRYLGVRLSSTESEPVLLEPRLVADLGNTSWRVGVAEVAKRYSVKVDNTGDRIGVTEIFDPDWQTMNSCSSRSVTIGEITVKGCGVTGPVDGLPSHMRSGHFGLREALHSFMISHLITQNLPLGGVPCLAVLRLDEARALYLRKAEGFRIAQLTTDLSADERELIQAQIFSFHGTTDSKEILKRIVEHFATAVFLGMPISHTPDNILIDGRFIDEEELTWPSRSGVWRVSLENHDSASSQLEELLGFYIRGFSCVGLPTNSHGQLSRWFERKLFSLWSDSKDEMKVWEYLKGPRDSSPESFGLVVENRRIIHSNEYQKIFRKFDDHRNELHRSNTADRLLHLLPGVDSFELTRQLFRQFSRLRRIAPKPALKVNYLSFEEGEIELNYLESHNGV